MRGKTEIFLLGLILLAATIIRTFGIEAVPMSLYWDEMDAAYQAYSIFKTGKDYFGNYPGLVVQSFADFRASGLIYAVMPFVALFGLNEWAIRIPAAIFGVLSVFLIYLLSQAFFNSKKTSLVAALIVAVSPWNIQYSRLGFEATLMLSAVLGGIVCFIYGLKNSKWWISSGVFFGLSMLTYNTAKLFVPLIYLTLVLIYIRKKALVRNFWLGSSILGLIFILGVYANIFEGGGQRFSEISILTDPQISAKTNYLREESALSYTDSRDPGLDVRLADRLIYNKATFSLDRITQNYLKAFSTDFLFVSGDPNLRHSPLRMGEFYRVEFITILLGLAFLFFLLKRGDKNSLFILCWVVLAPLPAVITRDGGTHATRLFLLFPALSLVSALGVTSILNILPKKINPIALFGLIAVWLFSFGFFVNYYFGAYKIESARYFQYGFKQAVQKAIERQYGYDYVIIDDRRDSALMNYLFETKYDPVNFQSQINSLNFELDSIQGVKLGKLIFTKPAGRDWGNIFTKAQIDEDVLLIVSSEQFEEETVEKVPNKLTKNQKLLDVIYYQTGLPAFYIIESKNSALSL